MKDKQAYKDACAAYVSVGRLQVSLNRRGFTHEAYALRDVRRTLLEAARRERRSLLNRHWSEREAESA